MSVCPSKTKNKQQPNFSIANDTNKATKDEKQRLGNGGVCARQPTDHGKGDRPYGRGNGRYQQSVRPKKSDDTFRRTGKNSEWHGKKAERRPVPSNLLKFKFEPRGQRTSRELVTNVRPHRQHYRKAFSKEEFLQANCQFIVSENGDYSVHSADPDIPVPWGKVEQVRVWTEEEWVCPICLDPPLAPKTTQCGHIFCWPCILHYLALDDKGGNSRKCPICNVAVCKGDLRSVLIKERPKLSVDHEITMRLMLRSRSELMPHAVTDTPVSPCTPEDHDMAKITPHSPLDILQHIIEPELEQLKVRLFEEMEDLESVFVKAALGDCEKREADVIASLTVESADSSQSELSASEASTDHLDLDEAQPATEAMVTDSDETSQGPGRGKNSKNNGKSTFYFYQCDDGRHLYLHGLNVKCLLREYSEFGKCPPIITGKIVTIESFTMTEELRKRHRYLSHLPLSCEYGIAELDLNGMLSEETLAEFKESMQQRAKHRHKKENQENRMLQRAEALEKKRHAQNASQWFESAMHGSGSTGSISVFVMSSAPQPPGDFRAHTTAYHESVGGEPNNNSTPSFAQMLRSGEVATPRPKAVWGKGQQGVGSDETAPPGNPKNDDSDDPDYVPPPTYQSSFGDALSSALDSMKVCNNVDGVEIKKVKGRKGKKGKKKQTLIFSTSAQLQHL